MYFPVDVVDQRRRSSPIREECPEDSGDFSIPLCILPELSKITSGVQATALSNGLPILLVELFMDQLCRFARCAGDTDEGSMDIVIGGIGIYLDGDFAHHLT